MPLPSCWRFLLRIRRSLDIKGQTSAIKLNEGITLGEALLFAGKALHFSSEAEVELSTIDDFAADKPFSIATWVYQPKRDDSFVVASQSDLKDKKRGWAIEIRSRTPSFRMTGDNDKSIRLVAGFTVELKPGSWNHLAVTYDGSREETGLALYVNGKAVLTQAGMTDRSARGRHPHQFAPALGR